MPHPIHHSVPAYQSCQTVWHNRSVVKPIHVASGLSRWEKGGSCPNRFLTGQPILLFAAEPATSYGQFSLLWALGHPSTEGRNVQLILPNHFYAVNTSCSNTTVCLRDLGEILRHAYHAWHRCRRKGHEATYSVELVPTNRPYFQIYWTVFH
jgi:hypothetical protein